MPPEVINLEAFTGINAVASLLIKLKFPLNTKLAQLLLAIWNPIPGEFFKVKVVPSGTLVLLITRLYAVGLAWSLILVLIVTTPEKLAEPIPVKFWVALLACTAVVPI